MRPLAGSDWDGNPETQPDEYEEHIGTVTDTAGNEWAVIQDQDGEEYLIDLYGWDY